MPQSGFHYSVSVLMAGNAFLKAICASGLLFLTGGLAIAVFTAVKRKQRLHQLQPCHCQPLL